MAEFTPAQYAEARRLIDEDDATEPAAFQPSEDSETQYDFDVKIDEARLRLGKSGRGELIPSVILKMPGGKAGTMKEILGGTSGRTTESEAPKALAESDPYLSQHILKEGKGIYRAPKFAEGVGEELSGIYEATKSKLSLGFAGEEAPH